MSASLVNLCCYNVVEIRFIANRNINPFRFHLCSYKFGLVKFGRI